MKKRSYEQELANYLTNPSADNPNIDLAERCLNGMILKRPQTHQTALQAGINTGGRRHISATFGAVPRITIY